MPSHKISFQKIGIQYKKDSQQTPVMHQFKFRELYPLWQKVQVQDHYDESRKVIDVFLKLAIQNQPQNYMNQNAYYSQIDNQILRITIYPQKRDCKKSCQKSAELMWLPHVSHKLVSSGHTISKSNRICFIYVQTDPYCLKKGHKCQHYQEYLYYFNYSFFF